MSFTGNGITNCYPDEVEDFVLITVLTVREVGDDVFGQLEVALGAGDAHVPQVGGQRRQKAPK